VTLPAKNRLAEAFGRAQREHRAALVAYLCAGDPDLETSERLLQAAAEAGADVIEVGMPFSDPTADGPVIQRASERALAAGTTLRGVLGLCRKLRSAHPELGLVLFGYYNPILAFGEIELAAAARDAGVDGVLVVDLPPEEAQSLLTALTGHGLHFVPLVAPTTPDARIDRIAKTAGSFLYYVSLTGVTGAEADLELAGKRAAAVRERTGRPVALGFGIKTPAQASLAAKQADGVVVGSAICAAVEQATSPEQAVADVRALVAALRTACAK
jgi:tryptophan synthase alpha chain